MHARLARRLGLRVASAEHAVGARRQSVFYANQFVLGDPGIFAKGDRVAVWYLHGASPDQDPALRACYDSFRGQHARLSRVQVSNRAMRDFVLGAGVDASKVFFIPIGVSLDLFALHDEASRQRARDRLTIPRDAVVVGSFQKDGVGWGDGFEPKLIKGPDVFVAACRALRARTRELFVLLSGPARGYVKRQLESAGIHYRHEYPRDYACVAELYGALDLYLVTSREEGGPKAVLEAMASGVPLVSTRVGQAADLVRHGENGWLAEVDDVEAIVHWSGVALADTSPASIRDAARATAEANAYERQDPLWADFHRGFVEDP